MSFPPIKLLCFILFFTCMSTPTLAKPANIIMVVADGMGPAYLTAYRQLKSLQANVNVSQNVFDRNLVGMASTSPHPNSGLLTDSAASATALATGVKTYNGAVGVNIDKENLLTVAEQAKKQGKRLGLVVTSQINHATPASYFTHHESRKMYDEIAQSYINLFETGKLDIALGGGKSYFSPNNTLLLNAFNNAGGHYIEHYHDLNNLPNTQPVMGLFADIALPKALDDIDNKRLLTMTKSAISYLSSTPEGFFLLVEASQIDWAGHDQDIVSAMSEMDDLANTLTWLEHYVEQNPQTLVVVTADHSTGGLTIGCDNEAWDPEIINRFQQTPHKMAQYLAANAIDITSNKDSLFTPEELQQIMATKKSALAQMDPNNPKDFYGKNLVEHEIFKVLVKIINQKTHTGWTTYAHTGEDVTVMAWGNGYQVFSGMQDNTDIAKKLFTLLKNE